MRHTDFAMRRPVTVLMAFIALVMVGLVAMHLLPVEQFPDVSFPAILVQIPYPGSTPEEVEQQIAKPVEEALATLSGIQEIRSTSTDKMAQIVVQFKWGAKIDSASFEVRSKLDGIRAGGFPGGQVSDDFAVALELNQPLDYTLLLQLATGLKVFSNALPAGRPLIAIIERDYAQALGQTVKAMAPDRPLLVIDQVGLAEGDYIDIGAPLMDGRVVPLSVKTLVFYH
jgi:hypothetical protein